LFIQTDYRSVVEIAVQMKRFAGMELINWIVWPYDWGGRPKDAFGRKHDDILYYAKKGGTRTFDAESVKLPKTVMMRSMKE